MRQVPLECDINIAVNGPSWVEAANPKHPFTAMWISHSRGTCLIEPVVAHIGMCFLAVDISRYSSWLHH